MIRLSGILRTFKKFVSDKEVWDSKPNGYGTTCERHRVCITGDQALMC